MMKLIRKYQALLKISINPKIINNKYFLFLFQTSENQRNFIDSTHGSAIKNVVSIKEIKQMPLKLPSLKKQQKIASILSNVDNTLDKTIRVIGGSTPEWASFADSLYTQIQSTYITTDIKTAEASKVIENTQRD